MIVKVFTDSGSDLNVNELRKYDLGVLPFTVNLDDKEYLCELDWTGISQDEMDKVLHSGRPFVPGRPPLQVWVDRLRPYVEQGYDVIYIAMSQKMTGSLQAFNLAIKVFESEGKVRPAQVLKGIDSGTCGKAQGLLTLAILEQMRSGASFEELKAFTKEKLKQTGLYIVARSGDWLVKNGRTGSEAEAITRPMFYIKDGYPRVFKTLDSQAEALTELMSVLPEKTDQVVFLVDPCNFEKFEFPEEIYKLKGDEGFYMQPAGPTLLNALGPDMLGIAWIY